jgi:AraC family transcriptional regulator
LATSLRDLLPLLAELSSSRDAPSSLAELAAALDRSPAHAQRVFTRLAGESPKRFDLRLRLELAAARLISTDRSVLDVALEVGFDSHEGFTRAFGRHFETSPRAFRAAHHLSVAERRRHAALLTSIGPCLRLYRAPLGRTAKGPDEMTYDITRKTLQPTPVLYQSRRVAHGKIAETLGEILPAVFGHAMKNQIPLAGPPLCRYVDWSPALVTLEAGLPVGDGAEPGDGVSLGELSGGEAAVTVHTGPYESLHDAHAAVERWLADNELEPAGDPWESYLTDPGEVPDPADWKTEIVWPCKPAA